VYLFFVVNSTKLSVSHTMPLNDRKELGRIWNEVDIYGEGNRV
jgi:hypothetical protein